MKKIVILTMLIVCLIGVINASAQKKDKKKDNIDPIGLDCDQISVSAITSGVINFSNPVIVNTVALVKKTTGEIVQDLPFKQNSNTSVKTVDLHRLSFRYDLFVRFEIVTVSGPVIALTLTEPCSRQIVIGQK